MHVITISNQKGGVGKTTTAAVLASGLTRQGYKVLAVDLDPQTNLTFASGIDPLADRINAYFVMKEDQDFILRAIKPTEEKYDLLPGSMNLAAADMEFTQTGREYILQEALEVIKDRYDYTIIDTPPNIGILTINALTASDSVIVPVRADIYSFQGLSQLEKLLERIRKHCNSDIQLEGLLVTQYDPRTTLERQMYTSFERLAERMGTKVYKTPIRYGVAIKEAQTSQGSLFKSNPRSNAAKDYKAFIDEFLEDRKDQ